MIALSLIAAAASPSTNPPCEKPTTVSAISVERAIGHRAKSGQRIVTGVDNPAASNAQATVYVRNGAHWLAYPLGDAQEIVRSYRTGDGHRLVLGFHTAEGPGEAFTALLFSAGGRFLACPRIAFPDTLNRNEKTQERDWANEFLSLDSISIDARGKGTIIASGDIDDGGVQRHVIYRYRSRDGGRTWRAPERIDR